MALPETRRPFTHEMVVVHCIFRREAELLPRIVRVAGERDKGAVVRTSAAVEEYIGGLHHHHALEDELVWPKIRERAGSLALSELMERQHLGIDTGLVSVQNALAAWRVTGSRADRGVLADALDAHRVCLIEHLDEEEASALPQVAEYLTVGEWDEVGRRGLERLPRSKVLLALGAILEDATPEERAYFLRKVPAAGRLMWYLVGRRQYARSMRVLRSPPGSRRCPRPRRWRWWRERWVCSTAATDAVRLLRSTFHGFAALEASGAFGHPRDIGESWRTAIRALHQPLRLERERRAREFLAGELHHLFAEPAAKPQ
jgi:hypothetical protein